MVKHFDTFRLMSSRLAIEMPVNLGNGGGDQVGDGEQGCYPFHLAELIRLTGGDIPDAKVKCATAGGVGNGGTVGEGLKWAGHAFTLTNLVVVYVRLSANQHPVRHHRQRRVRLSDG